MYRIRQGRVEEAPLVIVDFTVTVGIEVITNAKIQRQLRGRLPLILDVRRDRPEPGAILFHKVLRSRSSELICPTRKLA